MSARPLEKERSEESVRFCEERMKGLKLSEKEADGGKAEEKVNRW